MITGTGSKIQLTWAELNQGLKKTPMIAEVHPLIPLCLDMNARIITDIRTFQAELDQENRHDDRPALILSSASVLVDRFPHVIVPECPPSEILNQNMVANLEYARQHLLTTHKIADYIEQQVAKKLFDIIVLFLVDGLSYEDTISWSGQIQPCFVDAPSVTFRYKNPEKTTLAEDIGFPSIINRPSIYNRLYSLGYRHARGYTYWQRKTNQVADYMFEGIPYEQVENFETVLALLSTENYSHKTYIQIVREGLDGLAHHKRELRKVEIEAATQGILSDVQRLLQFFKHQDLQVCIYLTADHGILWKTEHHFQKISEISRSRPRYSTGKLDRNLSKYVVDMQRGGMTYSLFSYPYLGATIPSNDSGVHGGLSYQESIVPFAVFKG